MGKETRQLRSKTNTRGHPQQYKPEPPLPRPFILAACTRRHKGLSTLKYTSSSSADDIKQSISSYKASSPDAPAVNRQNSPPPFQSLYIFTPQPSLVPPFPSHLTPAALAQLLSRGAQTQSLSTTTDPDSSAHSNHDSPQSLACASSLKSSS